MPRPPILPLIDWETVFRSGKSFPDWIGSAEFPDKAAQITAGLQALSLEPRVQGFMQHLDRPVRVLAIAEDWCGDVVRHVPALRALEMAGPDLEVRFITREQWPGVFARFLTNGGEAIPKFIFLNASWVECGHWGPMPDSCRELIARGKAAGDGAGARQRVAARYAADPLLREVIAELLHGIDIAATGQV
nr:thioredoxin family protein [uncultured Holophaga sp.]